MMNPQGPARKSEVDIEKKKGLRHRKNAGEGGTGTRNTQICEVNGWCAWLILVGEQPDISPALTPRLLLHGDFIARTERITKESRSRPLPKRPRRTRHKNQRGSRLAVSDFFYLESKYFDPQSPENLGFGRILQHRLLYPSAQLIIQYSCCYPTKTRLLFSLTPRRIPQCLQFREIHHNHLLLPLLSLPFQGIVLCPCRYLCPPQQFASTSTD